MQQLLLSSSEEMFALGQSLAGSYKVLLLQGELGAGKTTLIKGFAAGLGIDPHKVNSPTYTYIQEYTQDSSAMPQNDGGSKKLLHIDMYNIDTFDQLVEKGIAELVHDYEYIAIEWPKFIDELGLSGAMIHIEKKDGDGREVMIDN